MLFSFLFALNANAQEDVFSKIPSKAKSFKDFIPKGYIILREGFVKGDLNKDGLVDVVMVVSNTDDSIGSDDRPLIVLFKTETGYEFASSSKKAVLCEGCGGVFGDPFAGLAIKKGILYINHYGGNSRRWTIEQKFRFQNNGFYLIGSTTDWFWIMGDCNGGVGDAGRRYKDVNWVTGDEEVIERDDDCKLLKHIKRKNKLKPLVKLETFTEKS